MRADSGGMNSSTIALYAAVATAASWTAKSLAIGTAGGLDKSPLEGPLFFAGLVCCTVAALALGVSLTRGRGTWLRAVAGVVGFVVFFLFAQLLDTAVDQIIGGAEADRHWVWAEVSLWVSAVLVLTLAVGRARAARSSSTVREVSTRTSWSSAR